MRNLQSPIGSQARIKEFNECFKELVALVRSAQWQEEELSMFGAPSECYQQVHLGLSREAMKILRKWGFTGFEHFAEEANQRGYGKLAYFSGIFMFA